VLPHFQGQRVQTKCRIAKLSGHYFFVDTPISRLERPTTPNAKELAQ